MDINQQRQLSAEINHLYDLDQKTDGHGEYADRINLLARKLMTACQLDMFVAAMMIATELKEIYERMKEEICH